MSMTPSLPSLLPPRSLAPGVSAFFTTRQGGVSGPPWGLAEGAKGGLNLGDHVGDDPQAVRANRQRLAEVLPSAPLWLRQVHGVEVFEAGASFPVEAPIADAAFTREAGKVLAVLTADCLPVLVADSQGRAVAVIHAGWRGLAAGVLEATFKRLHERLPEATWVAWLGPAIGIDAYEVGADVRSAMLDSAPSIADPRAVEHAFRPGRAIGKWHFDLAHWARLHLQAMGVVVLPQDSWCTAADPARFWSYRRDGVCGRIAGCIWIQPSLERI